MMVRSLPRRLGSLNFDPDTDTVDFVMSNCVLFFQIVFDILYEKNPTFLIKGIKEKIKQKNIRSDRSRSMVPVPGSKSEEPRLLGSNLSTMTLELDCKT